MFDLAKFPRKGEIYARRRDEACTPEEEKNWGPRRRCEATGIVRLEPRKHLAGVIGVPLIVSDAIFYNSISLCLSALELGAQCLALKDNAELAANELLAVYVMAPVEIVGYFRAAIYFQEGKGRDYIPLKC
jgi:hypothetical protein